MIAFIWTIYKLLANIRSVLQVLSTVYAHQIPTDGLAEVPRFLPSLLVSFCFFVKLFKERNGKISQYEFYALIQLKKKYFSLSSYFEADTSSASRSPPGLTAQGRGGGWNGCHMNTLRWFLTDVLLLVAAADNIP